MPTRIRRGSARRWPRTRCKPPWRHFSVRARQLTRRPRNRTDMSENNARLERDLYDYEHDEPRSAGGRRHRPVADWGVGDDVFEHMPRNRFSRAAEGPPRERRFASRSETAERRGGRDADRADLEGGAPEARDVAELDAAAPERRPAADV